MYPFAKIFSLGRYEPFYVVPGCIFIVSVLWNTFRGRSFRIPQAFYYLLAFVGLETCYNVGYTIFGEYNHVYNGSVYVFLASFMVAMYYYIREDSQRFSNLILWTTGICTLVYLCYFILDGFTIGHNSTLMYNINQFAFWGFLSYIVLDILPSSEHLLKWSRTLQLFLFLFVLFTLGRSATAGILLYILLKWTNTNRRIISLLAVSLASIIIISLFHEWLTENIELYKVYFNRFLRGREFRDFNSLIKFRGLSILFENPKYLLFGAGEGNGVRLGHDAWIHSSILNITFSYGIFGLGLFVVFIKKCWTQYLNVWKILIPVLVSSLFTSMTHNLHLWIILAILIYYRENIDKANHELHTASTYK